MKQKKGEKIDNREHLLIFFSFGHATVINIIHTTQQLHIAINQSLKLICDSLGKFVLFFLLMGDNHLIPNKPRRPSPAKNEQVASPVTRTLPPSSSTPPPPPPLSAPGMPSPSYRKRSRSDSLFPQETGPFFSSAKPFDNLFALDRTSL